MNPAAHSALVTGMDWKAGLAAALPGLAAVRPDAVFCFGAHHLSDSFAEILAMVRAATRAPVLIGCSTTTVISNDRELERLPAISLLALALPGAALAPIRFTPEMVAAGRDDPNWHETIGVSPDCGRGWFVFGDPFNVDGDALLGLIHRTYPGAPVVGGMAAAGPRDHQTWLFLNDDAFAGGAVGLALGGGYDLVPLVSQGCEPIGETWTITSVNNGWIETIGNRLAVQVLIETINALDADVRPRARRNMLIGIAADEYRPSFQRGDFLVRTVTGFDQSRGAIAVEGVVRAGQTVQFQMRDAATADLDLTLTLDHAKVWLDGRNPIAGVLNSCIHRGAALFGTSHHDAQAVAAAFRSPMIAGCFCSAEIGPVGLVPCIHGQSATIGLICAASR